MLTIDLLRYIYDVVKSSIPNGSLFSSVSIFTVFVLVSGAIFSSWTSPIVVRCIDGVVVVRSGGSAVDKRTLIIDRYGEKLPHIDASSLR